MLKLIKVHLTFLALLVIISCVTYTPVLKEDAEMIVNYGYLYGKFKIEDTSSSGKTKPLRLGLFIKAYENEETYLIQFKPSDEFAVIRIKPGKYYLKKFVAAGWDYRGEGEIAIEKKSLKEPFIAEPGQAYYIGDFFASSQVSYGTHKWIIDKIEDNYHNTTNEFLSRFRKLKNIETRRAIHF